MEVTPYTYGYFSGAVQRVMLYVTVNWQTLAFNQRLGFSYNESVQCNETMKGTIWLTFRLHFKTRQTYENETF